MSLVQKIESIGVRLQVEGDKLVVLGPVDQLTAKQVGYLRLHKPEIIAELKSVSQASPAERVRSLAGKYRIDPDELLSWYSQDIEDIQTMDELTLDALVRDYAANRPTFRGEQPYHVYQLWLYKLDKRKEGFIRQGIMTIDKEEALRRLEAIYGAGSVFYLHRKEH